MFSPKYFSSLNNRIDRNLSQTKILVKTGFAPPLIEVLESRLLLTATYNVSALAEFNGTNGRQPDTSLIMDSSGDLFGTTIQQGDNENGTVFELVKNGASYSLSTLVSFDGSHESEPVGGLVMDGNGNLYGTTASGGTVGSGGSGVLFELVRSGGSYSLSTLVQFDGSNGNDPGGALLMDHNGDLFGTTALGGSGGRGTIFELAKTGGGFALSTLVSFDGTNGTGNDFGVLMDAQGNLFSEFLQNSATQTVVYEAVKSGSSYTLQDIATFNLPSSLLVMDPSGNLYGTLAPRTGAGVGSVFELVKNGGSYTHETLASFAVTSGSGPQGRLTLDGSGNLFGIMTGGATPGGMIYEIPAGSGTIVTLATMDGTNVGFGGDGGTTLLLDNKGDIFGASDQGGPQNAGAIVELTPILHLAFASQPTSTVAGSLVNQVVVNIEDASNNIFVDYDARASLTASPSPGNLGGTVSNTVVNGVVIFKQCLEFINSGTYQLNASDSSGNTGATSNSFSITPAAAKKLVFAAGPTNISAGQTYNPPVVVYVMDQFGNIVRNVNSAVTLSVHSGPVGGTLHGTATVNLNNGAAIFSNVSLQTLGNYTLTAADGALTAITSPTFTVAAATASKLVFTTIPGTGTHGVNFTVKVSVEDAFGNVLTSQNSGTITLALATHPTGSFLSGTLTVNVANGVATFINLSVNFAGTYTLQASDNFGVGAATSSSIVVS